MGDRKISSSQLPSSSRRRNDVGMDLSTNQAGVVISEIKQEPVDNSYGNFLPSQPMSPYLGGPSAMFTHDGPSGITGLLEDAMQLIVPLEATSTLYIDNLPEDCTARELSHIFRPFAGYKEVWVVKQKRSQPGASPTVYSVAEFDNAAHATIALDALQGYLLDLSDPNSALSLGFGHCSRSGSGPPVSG